MLKKSITLSFFNEIKFYLAVRCKKNSVNTSVKFRIEILNGCWENSGKLKGLRATFLPHPGFHAGSLLRQKTDMPYILCLIICAWWSQTNFVLPVAAAKN